MVWEMPVAVAVAWLSAAVLLLPVARGWAGWLLGRGWVWPQGSAALRRGIGGLLTGRPRAGLAAAEAAQVPGPWAVYGVVGLAELLLLLVAVWAAVLWWRYLGPGAAIGMATRAEAGAVLGMARLRKTRRVVRPDLYGPPRGGPGTVRR
jgi:type IV secretion system protein VirD4